ncbi:hypothetical protein KAW18_02935 [candidate division WOR-3 bacterium]|nr:hypothetical protein [candidate division WOR-3 bacterium]
MDNDVNNQTLKEVLDSLFDIITKERRESEPYKDLFKKSDDTTEFLRDVNHKMMRVVLDATQVLRDKYGTCPNEVYNILKCLPFVADYMKKKIEREEGICCCVDKVYYLLSQKIKLELMEAEKKVKDE